MRICSKPPLQVSSWNENLKKRKLSNLCPLGILQETASQGDCAPMSMEQHLRKRESTACLDREKALLESIYPCGAGRILKFPQASQWSASQLQREKINKKEKASGPAVGQTSNERCHHMLSPAGGQHNRKDYWVLTKSRSSSDDAHRTLGSQQKSCLVDHDDGTHPRTNQRSGFPSCLHFTCYEHTLTPAFHPDLNLGRR